MLRAKYLAYGTQPAPPSGSAPLIAAWDERGGPPGVSESRVLDAAVEVDDMRFARGNGVDEWMADSTAAEIHGIELTVYETFLLACASGHRFQNFSRESAMGLDALDIVRINSRVSLAKHKALCRRLGLDDIASPGALCCIAYRLTAACASSPDDAAIDPQSLSGWLDWQQRQVAWTLSCVKSYLRFVASPLECAGRPSVHLADMQSVDGAALLAHMLDTAQADDVGPSGTIAAGSGPRLPRELVLSALDAALSKVNSKLAFLQELATQWSLRDSISTDASVSLRDACREFVAFIEKLCKAVVLPLAQSVAKSLGKACLSVDVGIDRTYVRPILPLPPQLALLVYEKVLGACFDGSDSDDSCSLDLPLSAASGSVLASSSSPAATTGPLASAASGALPVSEWEMVREILRTPLALTDDWLDERGRPARLWLLDSST